jgi:hypothetical protein
MRMGNSLYGVKKIDDSGFQRILRADNDEAVPVDQVLEEFRSVSKLTDGGVHIRTHGFVHERIGIAQPFRFQ